MTKITGTAAFGLGLSALAVANPYTFSNIKETPWYVVVTPESGGQLTPKEFVRFYGAAAPVPPASACVYKGELPAGLAAQAAYVIPARETVRFAFEPDPEDKGAAYKVCFYAFDHHWDNGGFLFVYEAKDAAAPGILSRVENMEHSILPGHGNLSAVQTMATDILFGLPEWNNYDSWRDDDPRPKAGKAKERDPMDSLGSSLESLLEGLEPVSAGPGRPLPAQAGPGALLDLRAAAPSPRGAFEFNWQVEGPRARGRAAKAGSAALKPKPVDPLDSLGSLADPGSGAASPSDLSAFSWKALPPAHPKKPGGAPGKTPLERLFDPPLTAVPEA